MALNKFSKHVKHLIFCFIVAFLAISCDTSMVLTSNSKGIEKNTTDGAFEIHLFKEASVTTSVSSPIEWQNVDGWKPLLEADLSTSDFVITEADIIDYDWNIQKITFRHDMGEHQLGGALFEEEYDYFVIALDKQPIIGGGTMHDMSPVVVRIPVMYVSTIPPSGIDNLEIYLRLHSWIYLDEEVPFPSDDFEIVERVRQRLRRIGKLSE